MKYFLPLFALLVFVSFASAQSSIEDFNSDEIEKSLDIINPNLLSTHPLGMYISRINHNFKIRSFEKCSFSFEISNGNVMLPYVKSYELNDPNDRKIAEIHPWYNREFLFNLNKIPAKTKEFIADGIIRSYRFNFRLPLTVNHELSWSIRSYSLDKGKYPTSVFTADESIEWFHSKIAGGEDPFSRRYYGFNKAELFYKDEKNDALTMRNGEFKIQGIEMNYFYYPQLNINKKHKIYLNFGSHLGINTSKYNPVADLGLSSSATKKIVFRNQNILSIGLSTGILQQKIIQYGSRVNISNQPFLYSFEGLLDYKKKLKSNNSISYGINYAFQTSYNKKSDFNHIIMTGERIKTHWQQTISHLYQNLEGWNFIFKYSVKQFSYYVYLREDFRLDNAPDLQTGFGLQISLKKKA